jgi:ferric-dicitrate binding protein FerR (iron transport regulator)
MRSATVNHGMSTHMNGPGRRAVLSAAALAVFGTTSAAAANEAAGKVDELRGEGYAVAAAVQRPLSLASAVFLGDLVGTRAESTMRLSLGTATEVRLGPEANLRIDRFIMGAEGVLVLQRGGILFDHAESAPKANVLLRSPYGLIAVRGTRYFAGPSAGVFGVFVQRGAVDVLGVNISVRVTAGMGTNIASPGAEPTTPTVWGAPRIAAALALVGAR